MNTTLANTEPFFRFHLFNEEFNRNLKVTVGSLEFVKKASKKKKIGAKSLTVLPTGGEPWGKRTTWRETSVSTVVEEAKRFLSQMGIVRVISAFEDFLITIEAEYDRFATVVAKQPRNGKEKSVDADSAPRLEAVAELLDIDLEDEFPLLPILNFFQIARNCIVHRSGRASEALSEEVESDAFRKITKQWRSDRKKRLPKFPTIDIGNSIPFHPRHAILASEVYYRVAKILNAALSEILGEDGFIYMAAYHTLLADRPILVDARRSPEALVNYALFNRYLVKEYNPDQTPAKLKHIGKWDECRKFFEKHFRAGAKRSDPLPRAPKAIKWD